MTAYVYTATWLKPAVRVVGVGPRCGTPASARASAASNVLHVTRLRKRYFHSSQRVDCVDINKYRATQRFILHVTIARK